MGILKTLIQLKDRFLPSQDQKEITEVIKQVTRVYGENLGHKDLITDFGSLFAGKKPSISVEAGVVSTEAVRLADLFTLTFVDRERFQVRDLMKAAYISRHLSEHALIPSEQIQSVQEGEETRYFIVYDGQEITIDKNDLKKDGTGKLSLKVEKFREIVTEQIIGEKFKRSEADKKSITEFRQLLESAAEKDPETKAVVLALIGDQLDTHGIANEFGGPELEKYAQFADVPVSVLAIHNVLSAIKLPPIQYTSKGELHGTWVKKVFAEAQKTGDPKLVRFLEELTGRRIDPENGKKVIYLEGKRKGKFEVLLPVVMEVVPQVQQAININGMFSDEQHQQAMVALTGQCDGYVAAAVASGAVGADIAADLNEQAEQFVQDIEDENEKTGRYDYLNSWFNKQQAQLFATSFTSYVGELQKSINLQTENEVAIKFTALQKEVQGEIGKLGVDEQTQKTFARPLAPLSVRPVNIQTTYAADMAILSANVVLVQRIQEMATHRITQAQIAFMAEHPDMGKEELAKEKARIAKEIGDSIQPEISKILTFTAQTIDGVKKKEELRTFEVVLGQIKYEGLSTAAAVFEEKKKQIEAELEKTLNGVPKSKTEKGLNGELAAKQEEIKQLQSEKQSLVLSRGKTVQDQYAEQFELDIKKWYETLKATTGGTMLPEEEFKKLIREARASIGKKAYLTTGKNPTITTEQLRAEYSTQFQKIVIMNTRYQHKGEPKASVDQIVKMTVGALVGEGVASPEGVVTGVGLITGNLARLDESLGLVAGKNPTNEAILRVDEQIETIDGKIKKAEEEERTLREQIEQKKKEAQEKILKEEKSLRLVEARIRSVEFAQTATMLAERIKYFEKIGESLETPIDLSQLGFELDPETKKLYENYMADREKYAKDIVRVLEEAKEKRAKLFTVAQEEYDFIMQEDANGVITSKFFDNPTRIANDINPTIPETYSHLTRIAAINQILAADANSRQSVVARIIESKVLTEAEIGDGLTDSVLTALLATETEAVKPAVEAYKGLEGDAKIAFERDYVRYTRFATGQYIFIDPTKEIQPQLDAEITSEALTTVSQVFVLPGTETVSEEVHTADPIVTPTPGTTTVDPKQPSQETIEFVENYLTQQMLLTIQKNPSLVTNAQEGSEIAALVASGVFDTSGAITEKGQEYIKQLRLDMYQLSKKLPKFGTDERRAFITGAATHYVAKTKSEKTIIPTVAESMGSVLTECEELGLQEESRGPQAVEAEVQENVNISPVPYIKPTDKSVELALKEVSKTLKKLDAKIAQAKWERRQAEIAELRRQNAGGGEIVDDQVDPPVDDHNDDQVDPPVEEDVAKKKADAQLRQTYLSVVYDELFAKFGGMTHDETTAIFAKLDVELDAELCEKYKRPDGTVDTVALIEGETGVKLPDQVRAITAQIATVKNGKVITDDGVIQNASNTNVEERLYARFRDGEIEEAIAGLNSTGSASKRKYIARNIVIHTLGQGLIEQTTVQARAAQLGTILEEAGYTPPYDSQTLKDLVAGKLPSKTKEGEMVSIAPVKQPVQQQVETNTRTKTAEAGDTGMGS